MASPLMAAPAAPVSADRPAIPASRELGFVLTAFAPAIYQGQPGECPEGLVNTIRENYLAGLPAEERLRLSQKANETELTARWKASVLGPNNTNLCSNPEAFQRPPQKTFKGRVSYGLNLDGDEGSGAGRADECEHESFVSPTGERGIDNQVYRAMGCYGNYRGVDGKSGDVVRGWNNALATGEQTIVLLIRGIDDYENDPDVEIVFANTNDRPVLDSKRNFITGVSYHVGDNPRWRNVLHGRIVNGVLSTDPIDVHLTQKVGQGGPAGERAEWDLRKARLRLEFQPDGSLKGLLGAYQPPRNVIQGTILGGLGAATVAGIDCASQYAALVALADGLRDPKSGKCTALSTALDVEAVPAYVIDPAAKPRIAVR